MPQHVANDEAVCWRADIVLGLQLGQDVDALHAQHAESLDVQLVEASGEK